MKRGQEKTTKKRSDEIADIIPRELTLDSREVAEMVGKRHSDLLRDIETYISYISQNANLRYDDFFLESSSRT